MLPHYFQGFRRKLKEKVMLCCLDGSQGAYLDKIRPRPILQDGSVDKHLALRLYASAEDPDAVFLAPHLL